MIERIPGVSAAAGIVLLALAPVSASGAELRRGDDRLSLALRTAGSVASTASFEGGAAITAELGDIQTDLGATIQVGRSLGTAIVEGAPLATRGNALSFNAGWSSDALDLAFGAAQRRNETVSTAASQPQLLATQVLANTDRSANFTARLRASDSISLDVTAQTISAIKLVEGAAASPSEQISRTVGIVSGARWQPVPAFAVQTQIAVAHDRVALQGDGSARFARSAMTPRLIASFTPASGERLQLTAEQVAIAPVLLPDVDGARLQDAREWRVVLDARQPLLDGLALTTGLTLAARQGATEFGAIDGAQYPVTVGSGLSRRIEVGLTADLAVLGLDGATLTGTGSLRRSIVDDPVTGGSRRASGEVPVQARLSFAQSLPLDRARWGINTYVQGPTQYFGARDMTTMAAVGGVGAFVDYTPGPVRLQFRIDNLLGGDRDSRIDHYDGLRGSSEIDRIERRGVSGRAVSIFFSGKV